MPPRIAAGVLWTVLAVGVVLIVLMTWHPWVIGSRAGCAPGTARGWDGRCRSGS